MTGDKTEWKFDRKWGQIIDSYGPYLLKVFLEKMIERKYNNKERERERERRTHTRTSRGKGNGEQRKRQRDS